MSNDKSVSEYLARGGKIHRYRWSERSIPSIRFDPLWNNPYILERAFNEALYIEPVVPNSNE